MMKNWSNEQIESHRRAAKILDQIMADTFDFISKNKNDIDEYQVQQFIFRQFAKNNLVTEEEPPIVAFGHNTENVHYFPSEHNCAKLKPNDLIMIDIWAREDGLGDKPFADITWMGFNGKEMPSDQTRIFDLVIEARDSAVGLIEESLAVQKMPVLGSLDRKVHQIFRAHNAEANFLHTTGHVLGFYGAHGDKAGILDEKNLNKVMANVGYTIEPGLYFTKQFGVRSEIDFYVDDEFNIIITTEVQKSVVMLG